MTISGLTPQTQYFMRVLAVNSHGESDWSATESILTIESVSGDFTINENGDFTNTRSVTLQMDMAGISQMQFSNDNTNWSSLTPYLPTKTWTLASTDGIKTVHARFINAVGTSFGGSDDILLDTLAPVIRSFAVNDGNSDTYSSSVILNNDVIGAAYMRFSDNGIFWTVWVPFDLTSNYIIPENENTFEYVLAEFKDDHGNVSSATDGIKFDAIRTVKILPISLRIDHASDGGSSGEIYWAFSGTNGITNEDFPISSRSRNNYITMPDGSSYAMPNNEFGTVSLNRGVLGNVIYINFQLMERDSDNNDDGTGMTSISLTESDDWYIGQYYNFTVGDLDSGPLGTMRFIGQFVD